jgi:hypothetical protein
MLQLPQTGTRIISVHRAAQRLCQTVLLVRRNWPHTGGMPYAPPARLESKVLRTPAHNLLSPWGMTLFFFGLAELRPLWAYCACVP